MTSAWKWSGTTLAEKKGRDGQKKKTGKANEKRKKGKSKKE